MGVHCNLIPITERRLMDLDEGQIERVVSCARDYHRGDEAHLYAHTHEADLWNDVLAPFWLEKAWYPLFIFLTNEDPSEYESITEFRACAEAIHGGRPIRTGTGDVPIRYLWAAELRIIAEALETQTPDELTRRYFGPSSALEAAYDSLAIFPDDTLERNFSWLVDLTQSLGRFYRKAADHDLALLLDLN